MNQTIVIPILMRPNVSSFAGVFRMVLLTVMMIQIAPSTAVAQGGLTPPGAPAPTMKTLQQVEPRTPISSLPFTISQPGSYYLTTNLTGVISGLTIDANGVTLDLMGFELVGGTSYGVNMFGNYTNVVIRNGTIRNWGSHGILAGSASTQCVFENLRVFANGGTGVSVGNASRITGCSVYRNGVGVSTGPGSLVTGCTVNSNNSEGIIVGEGSTVRDCIVQLNTYGWGIYAANGSTILNCTVSKNCETNLNVTPSGIYVGDSCTVKDCTVFANGGVGIRAGSGNTIMSCTVGNNYLEGILAVFGNTIQNCTVKSNGRSGIQVQSSNLVKDNMCDGNPPNRSAHAGITTGVNGGWNRVEGNTLTYHFIGIRANGTGNLILRNWAAGNLTAYSFDPGNVWASPTVTTNNISANTSPHANYAY